MMTDEFVNNNWAVQEDGWGGYNQQQQREFSWSPQPPTEREQATTDNFNTPILRLDNFDGPGRKIGARDIFYAFNLNASNDSNEPDMVLDVYFTTDSTEKQFALVKMASEKAAKMAKSAMDQSWLFDKFIRVRWANRQEQKLIPAGRVPIAATIHSSRKCLSQQHNQENKRQQLQQNGNNNSANANVDAPRWGQFLTSNGDDARREYGGDLDQDEQQSQAQKSDFDYYATELASEWTRHMRPGTVQTTDGWNLSYVRRSRMEQQQQCTTANGEEDERYVERERAEPSPVLHVSGLEMYNDVEGRLLTRLDLLQIFFIYGEVVDIEIGIWKQNPIEVYNRPCRRRALIQMRTIEQATHAMHSLDHSWQMGRELKVTYAGYQSIEYSNNLLRDIKEGKRFRWRRLMPIDAPSAQNDHCDEEEEEEKEVEGNGYGQESMQRQEEQQQFFDEQHQGESTTATPNCNGDNVVGNKECAANGDANANNNDEAADNDEFDSCSEGSFRDVDMEELVKQFDDDAKLDTNNDNADDDDEVETVEETDEADWPDSHHHH